MRNLKLIIKREYLARVRNKTFVIMTFLSPLIFVGMIVLIAYLAKLNNDETKVVAIHDANRTFYSDFENTNDINYLDVSTLSVELAKEQAMKDDYYGLLVIPKQINNPTFETEVKFFSKESPSFIVISNIENTLSRKLSNMRLLSEGVESSALDKARASVNLDIENFQGEKSSKLDNITKMVFGGIAGYLLMMFIIIYGNMVMRSVIEEKVNRIIEIIISSVKPIHLMLGKILGTSLAGITQFTIWVILGSILLTVVTTILGIDTSEGSIVQQQALEAASNSNTMQDFVIAFSKLPLLSLIVCFFLYFTGGYFLYSSIYAAIGAAVDSETDTQQFMLPVILPLMLGIYVGFFSVIENPHGTVSVIFSMIPLTSPIVMLMRIPFGVPIWEVALSMLILALSIWGMVWLAAKIYKVGILKYGKKPTFKELYKWLKY
jgi:ABC-2 type transport system permease protein